MKRRGPAILMATAISMSVGVSMSGCKGSEAPHGPPVLLKVYWASTDAKCAKLNGQCVAWSRDSDPDPDRQTTVPPAPSQFNLVFDRVMDGGKIEDTVIVNGVARQQPKAMPPVTVTWPDMAAAVSDPPFSIGIWYNSVHLAVAAASTAYVYGREVPAYPSNTTLTITLDKMGLTSAYNEPMDGPATIDITTDPFLLAVSVPEQVPTNYWVPLKFNSRVGDATTAVKPHVHVLASGGSAEFKLVPEPMDPTLLYLQPVDHGGIWPSGTRVDVTVDETLVDLFGAPLGKPTTVSFTSCEPIGADGAATACVLGGGTDGGSDADGGVEMDSGTDAAVD